MKNLTLKNFKAFCDQVDVDFDFKNALIYGENGSGKSSIYEAIKLWFYTDKVFVARCDKTLTSPPDIQNNKNDILDSYNHQKAPATRFTLLFNGTSYSSTATPTGYNVCMVSRTDIEVEGSVEILELLDRVLVGVDNASAFMTAHEQDMKDLINATVSKDFGESNLEIDFHYDAPQWYLVVKDTKRHLSTSRDLSIYFNEGKLHLIILLFLLTAAQLNGKSTLNKILVLDDVITSLDAANRTFLIKYIHEYLEDWQKIIMTHSSSFFNQMDHSFRRVWGESDQWKPFRVQEHEEESSIVEIDSLPTGKQLRDNYTRGTRSGGSLPNDIRKRFEYLVTELSGMLCVGGIAEVGQILNAINNKKDYYYYYDTALKSHRSIFDMVEELVAEISSSSASTLKTNLETIVNKYKNSTELLKLHQILQSLMIYQKVTMHAGSHATGTITPLTDREMDRSITLIQDMEKLMGNLLRRDMYSI